MAMLLSIFRFQLPHSGFQLCGTYLTGRFLLFNNLQVVSQCLNILLEFTNCCHSILSKFKGLCRRLQHGDTVRRNKQLQDCVKDALPHYTTRFSFRSSVSSARISSTFFRCALTTSKAFVSEKATKIVAMSETKPLNSSHAPSRR